MAWLKYVFFAALLTLDMSICFMEPHSAQFEVGALLNGCLFGWIASNVIGGDDA